MGFLMKFLKIIKLEISNLIKIQKKMERLFKNHPLYIYAQCSLVVVLTKDMKSPSTTSWEARPRRSFLLCNHQQTQLGEEGLFSSKT